MPGGPGGFAGGNGDLGPGALPGSGLGPGGGNAANYNGGQYYGGHASHGTLGEDGGNEQAGPGETYGNAYLLPLIGGSGGGGGAVIYGNGGGGGGGGGALLIAANGEIRIMGSIVADGSDGARTCSGQFGCLIGPGGGGSGGAIRLVATSLTGNGTLWAQGGAGVWTFSGAWAMNRAGSGRVRIDALNDAFGGQIPYGIVTRGFQPIIIPPANQAVGLAIQSVGGVAVAVNPSGQLAIPDVIVPANQPNPVPIVVRCTNIPSNTEIIVDVRRANGTTVRAIGVNDSGTQNSSTATVQVNMPRGGGTIQAKAISGIAGTLANRASRNKSRRSLAETGWTAEGERFTKVEVAAAVGGSPEIAYITESGKRHALPRK